jgi:hypothetical protein
VVSGIEELTMEARNADSSQMNDSRNAMTNAERQRRYRDKRRGGPPVGRWPNGAVVARIAKAQNVSRTMIYMAGWIVKHAPDVAPLIEAGKIRLTPTYKRLRREYDRAVYVAIRTAIDAGHDPHDLMVRRENGVFVVE